MKSTQYAEEHDIVGLAILEASEERWTLIPFAHKPLFEFQITVSDPQKVGNELINGHVVYKVSTWTNCLGYRNESFAVVRRYSDFLWLYSQLTERFPGAIIPPLPGKHVIGRFQEEFIEARRSGLERFIQKVARHNLVQQDPNLRLFLESPSFSADKKEERTSILSVFGGAGNGLNAASAVAAASANAGRIVDDEYLENRRFKIESQDEMQLKALLRALEGLLRQRRDVGNAYQVFGGSLISLSKLEAGKEIGRNLMLVGEIQKRIKELRDKQSGVDLAHLARLVEEYIRVLGSVRVAFAGRMKAFTAWQSADLALKRKREAVERARGTVGGGGGFRAEEVVVGLNNLPELESQLATARNNLRDVTQLVHKELTRYDKERISDFTASVQTVLRSFLETQKQVIAMWESYYELSGQEIPAKESVQ
ncbi:Vps5 C terminal like-domain-containing protein [Chytriomyces sp. MP71]|nr:Vps5 C terminal like-domain-containing protein [Chytriomyces sp. MP71]